MNKTEGPNTGSFVKKAYSMRMDGMMILIMMPLLLMMLQATPWPPSYKPPQLPMYDGHSDPKQFLMSYEATISSYGGQYYSNGEVLRHGSPECSPNMVFFSSARDYHVMTKA
jgi:hypothetical protein